MTVSIVTPTPTCGSEKPDPVLQSLPSQHRQ